MATSPTGRQHPPLPAPPRQTLRRMTPEEVMQPTKAQKTSKDTTIRSTEEATKEPQPLRQRINAVTLSNGTSITSYTNDNTSEDQTIIFDNEGYDEAQLLEEMKHESNETKLHDVFNEVDASTIDDNVIKEAILQGGSRERKGQACEIESSRRRSRTKTPSTPLHQCSRPYGHFSHYRCNDQTGSRDKATSLQHFGTHPSPKTTTANNATSSHLKNFVHYRTNCGS